MARRILSSIQLDKIAAVDRPCQEHAVVAILKRAPDEADLSKAVEKALMDNRLEELRKRVLLAKTGVALLSTMMMKEWDESKHPRADDGRFGEGSGGIEGKPSSSSDTKEGDKSAGHSKILRVLQLAAGLGVAYNVAQAAVLVAGTAGLVVGAGPGAGAIIGSMGLVAAGSYVLKAAGLEIARRILRRMNKAENPSASGLKQIQQQIANLSPEQANKFNEQFMAALSPEQADAVATKMMEIVQRAKTKLKNSKVEKMWSDAARAAAAEARKRAGHHRDEAKKHKAEGRTITAMKHEVVADHYLEAADHYEAGRKQRGHDVRRQGEAILGIHKASEIKKAWSKRWIDPLSQKIKGRGGPLPEPVDFGPRRGKQGPRTNKLTTPAGMGLFGVNKMSEVIEKSSIVLSVLPDPEERVRKVIGNTAADYIHDFTRSTNPRFKGKSKEERIHMALGAYYGRNK